MYKRIFLVLFFYYLTGGVRAQLSQGGSPLEVNNLKTTLDLTYLELPVPKSMLEKEKTSEVLGNRIKPFLFAHTIPVSLSTKNSGKWYKVDNYRVWQLRIHSAGAKSLNLIFDQFHLPEGARLFLFSEDKRDLIGAFTEFNNKADKKFATSPVIGDRLIVQYEEPLDADFEGELSIKSVNHDFVGIKSLSDDRRPLGESGSCNVNINCDYLEHYRLVGNSVCRVLVSGKELCTGTLLNNTSNDGTPYVYTAGHCIDDEAKASETIFLFNYESPYCGSIDGEVNHSLSGSSLRAQSDSLDFSLVELSVKPPKSFRPYYMGWNRSDVNPDSSVCIHHPLGDIKKIAIDRHSPYVKSYSSDYVQNAFYLINNWEEGTTEGGSSGAPMIDQNMRVVGSLTGGAATCELPHNDYFARMKYAWDYYPEASKQLKAWLDPNNSSVTYIDGLNLYDGVDLCGAFTNFTDGDIHENLVIEDQGVFKGYWGGNNTYGFSSFAEKFSFRSESEISGISLGVATANVQSRNSTSTIRIDVFEGSITPENLLYQQEFLLRDIDEDAMNYFEFSHSVQTNGQFFIAYSIDNVRSVDAFSAYLAKRIVNPRNTFYIKDGDEWYTYKDKSGTIEGSSILMEAILCNIDTVSTDPPLKVEKFEAKAYPNPFRAGQKLFVEFEKSIQPRIVQVFDLMGRQIDVTYNQLGERWLDFDFSGKRPGIYFLKIADKNTSRRYHLRVSYLGGD